MSIDRRSRNQLAARHSGAPAETDAPAHELERLFPGDSECAHLMRSLDWSETPLGPVSRWSQALRTMLPLLLHNRFPLILWWGPEFVQFYNDIYRPIPGARHPRSMGQPASECWLETWDIIGPLIEAPYSGQPATTSDDLELLVNRRGFLEETHYKVAYSPVPDESVRPTGVGGVLATVAEITEQVYGERQLKTLRELGARVAKAKTPEQACEQAAVTLAGNPSDVPFALFYLLDAAEGCLRLAAGCGFDDGLGPANPAVIRIAEGEGAAPWPLGRVLRDRRIEVIGDLATRFEVLPSGRWPEPPRTGIALPLAAPDQPDVYGVLIVGVSPHRALEDSYQAFYELVAAQIVTAIRETALHKSEQRYRTLFDSIDEGFCVIEMLFDQEGNPVDYRFLETNPAFERQTGLTNAVGRRMRDLAPDHEEHWFTIYGQIALSGKATRFERPASALGHWYDVYAFRVGRPEDRQVAILFNDIAERKRAEEALRDADRRKDEFLATLSHELRNPLAPIRSAIQLLQLDRDSAATRRQALAALDRQVTTLTQLVNDLLDVSRVTTGRIELHRAEADVNEIARDTAEAMRPLFDERNQEFIVSLHDTPLPVLGDSIRLDQVLVNLLSNAAKYTPEGGRIVLTAAREGGEAVIRVGDTGVGIAPDLEPHLFELFSQGARSLDRAQGGLGIGLSLVKRLVEMHGGTVTAKSEGSGRGSEFAVRLPLDPSERETRQRRPTADGAERDTGSLRVLVVDDNADAANTTALLLRQQGHDTRAAYDGPSALEAAWEFAPDAVLLDIGLPGMDGYEVAVRIRAEKSLEHVVLVAMTGYGQPEDLRRAREAGFDRHLVKPAEFDELQSILSSIE